MQESSYPFFSIIIPVYNRAEILRRTLNSILSQDFFDLEVIIVDDGSTDNPEKRILEYSNQPVSLFKIKNVERGAARNYGVKFAKGKYLNFFDSDDLYLPCLRDLKSFIELESSPAVIYGGIEHVNEFNELAYVDKLPYQSFTDNLLHNNFLACGSVFLRRDIALEFPFNEDRRLSSAEDWELWLRVHVHHQFTRFPKKIFKQVHHKNRSIREIKAKKIEKRDCYFISLVTKQNALLAKYGKKALMLFKADRLTFVALSYSEEGRNSLAYVFWRKALQSSMLVMRRRRFWAVLKKLILK